MAIGIMAAFSIHSLQKLIVTRVPRLAGLILAAMAGLSASPGIVRADTEAEPWMRNG